MRLLLALLLLSACSSSNPTPASVLPLPADVAEPQPQTVEAPTEPSGQFDPEVLRFVSESEPFNAWTLAPVRQYQRDGRTVLVVWPMLNSDGRIVDDDTLSVVVHENADGGHSLIGSFTSVLDMARAQLVELLGGEDYSVFPSPGLELEQIGPSLVSIPEAFCRQIAARNPEGAIPEVSQLARVYAASDIAQLENVAEILIGECDGRMTLAFEDNHRVSSTQAEVRMTITPTGASQGDRLTLQAATNESGLWVFTGERSR